MERDEFKRQVIADYNVYLQAAVDSKSDEYYWLADNLLNSYPQFFCPDPSEITQKVATCGSRHWLKPILDKVKVGNTKFQWHQYIGTLHGPVFPSFQEKRHLVESGSQYDVRSWEDLRNFYTKFIPKPGNSSCGNHHCLKRLLDAGILSDCVLKVGASEFQCHRCILALHSPVFRLMFEHKTTKEAGSGMVKIEDTTSTAVETMLEYMYTGSCTLSDEQHAAFTLDLAEKYQIPRLKEECESALRNYLGIGNVIQMIDFADTHNASNLFNGVVEFVAKHRDQIFETSEWKSFKKNNLELAVKILEKAMMNEKHEDQSESEDQSCLVELL